MDVKILSRRDCRNKNKHIYLMQVRALILKAIENNGGKVVLDLLAIFVEERLRVAVCHRCSQFGHVQKYCAAQSEIKGPRCSGNHPLSECESTLKCCPNCARYGMNGMPRMSPNVLFQEGDSKSSVARLRILTVCSVKHGHHTNLSVRVMQQNCQRSQSVVADIERRVNDDEVDIYLLHTVRFVAWVMG
ncbi:hypothetical protein Zmor_004023 [Zophobas morio]|uniref:CCHC-type domain-containing protein n=1 Tax=Zophobas morio TaxID=2755281 RepID=A0AA38HMH8_9CUCU|nr:hypothetical protein Zmor_004023 [Zophobas morio]